MFADLLARVIAVRLSREALTLCKRVKPTARITPSTRCIRMVSIALPPVVQRVRR
jgi:hypothetical protein